jgi:hypothetical protein
MPHASVKLRPGVDQNQTPALNEAGISESQLIRFIYDRTGLGLVQKLGGWVKFFPNYMLATVRALWAWQDTEANKYLGVGTQNVTNTFETNLSAIRDGAEKIITPTRLEDNITPVVSTTAGSSIVTITDTTIQNQTIYNSVYVATPISIGGLVIFGLYQCNPDNFLSATAYHIQAKDALGAPLAAGSSSSSPTLPVFDTVSGDDQITVTFADHGETVGSTFSVVTPTLVGGVLIYGNYIVIEVISSSQFVIVGDVEATATATATLNGGRARYIYSFGLGAVPPGTGYGVGTYGSGGYGTGTGIIPATGDAINAEDWTLDNWGEQLISTPIEEEINLTITGISTTGTAATFTFSESYTPVVGEYVVITNVNPVAYNGSYYVTASAAGSLTVASTETAAYVSGGGIYVFKTPFQPVYKWDPLIGQPFSTILSNGPVYNDGSFVAMPQRQIVTWGSTVTGVPDPLLLRWCDVNNYEVWIGTVTNQAGQFRLPKGSRIVGCLQAAQQALVWTDINLYSMQYIGPPFIYSFNEVGANCGLIAKKAAGAINGVFYWMGPTQFFTLAGSGVQTVSCPVWDVIFQDLDLNNLDKIRCAVNTRFDEVTWYYPTDSNGGEVNAYVKYNVGLQIWDYGTLSRTAWIDQSVFGAPIGADGNNNYIYQHEVGYNNDTIPMVSSFTTGYFVLNEADLKMFIDQIWPDMKWGEFGGPQNATVNLTFNVLDYAGATPKTYGPFPMTKSTEYITPRFRGRLVSITLESNDADSFWRIGNIRYRVQQDGKF